MQFPRDARDAFPRASFGRPAPLSSESNALRDDGKKCAAANTTGEREREREREREIHDALFHGTESARREPREPPSRDASTSTRFTRTRAFHSAVSSRLPELVVATSEIASSRGITRKMRRNRRKKKKQKQSHATHPVPVSARTRPSAYLTSTIWARLSALSASSDLEPC